MNVLVKLAIMMMELISNVKFAIIHGIIVILLIILIKSYKCSGGNT